MKITIEIEDTYSAYRDENGMVDWFAIARSIGTVGKKLADTEGDPEGYAYDENGNKAVHYTMERDSE